MIEQINAITMFEMKVFSLYNYLHCYTYIENVFFVIFKCISKIRLFF